MEKVDLKKQYKTFYTAPVGSFCIIDIPSLPYLMVNGDGDPNTSPDYVAAIEALYTTSYTLKFMCKDLLKRDYVVPPLEGLWWADNMDDFVNRNKERWQWTMMILVPDFIEKQMAEDAIARARAKKNLPGLSKIRFAHLNEGKVVQTMHIGPYDAEGPILKQLHEDFIPTHNLVETGHHHEIYLGDPRRQAPEKLKTILRQPVKTKA